MKKLLSLLLACAMLLSIVGCTSTDDGKSGSASTPQSSSDVSKEDVSKGTDDPADIKQMVVALTFWVGALPDTQLVQDAINEITVKELGIEMEFQISDAGSFKQNMTLALSGGETIDIMSTLMCEYPNLVQQGYLKNLDEDNLLEEYGKGIIEALGQDPIDACRIDGTLYGLPNNRDFAQGRGCASIGTQFLEGIGYEFPETDDEIIKISLDELNEIYVKLHEKYPEMEVYRPVTGSMNQFSNVDSLGGSVFGVLLDYGKELDVVNLFESDFYMDYCKRMYDYNQKGYISQDATTDTTAVGELVKAGTLMSYTTGGKPGIKMQETSLCGQEMTIFQTLEDFVGSASISGMPWAIPENTSDPVAAMKLLNIFYENADVSNLISWGIEGQHYEVLDNGQIAYPEGVDASTSGWNHSMGWQMPNQFNTYVWDGNAPTLWNDIDTFNKEAEKSAASGFTFNSQNVMTEMTSVQNVYDEYQKSLEFGMVDPVTGIPELNEKMKSAGLDVIIAEKQAQLDAWAAAK